MIQPDTVMEALARCHDPCCAERGLSVVDMGLVEGVRIDTDRVEIDLVLTTGWCPSVSVISNAVVEEVAKVDGVGEVEVNVVCDPVWTTDRLSPVARRELEMPLEALLPYRERRLAATMEEVAQ